MTADLSRISTTTISLPMPFILANAWLASALMEFPDCAPLIWRMIRGWPVRQICVGYHRGRRKAHDASVMGRKPILRVNLLCSPAASGKTLLTATAEKYHGDPSYESMPLFSSCYGRAGPGSRDFAGTWQCTGANAASGSSRCEYADSADACPIRNSRPGPTGNPGAGRRLPGGARHPTCSCRDPGDTAAGRGTGPDRGSVRRTN